MTEMSIAPDAVRADAAWLRGLADEITEITWPAVELDHSEAASAVRQGVPGLAELATDLRAWAESAAAAADALAAADQRARGGLTPP